jgi:NADPH:quinone reductase-like Zn-dependent oxidoreductase
MKAFLCHGYGSPDVLKYEEIAIPACGDNEVLVKIRAASVNPVDLHLIAGKPFPLRLMLGGLFKPKSTSLVIDLAGQVEAVGREVTQFKPGDEVFGTGKGAFAEYVCAAENNLALKPANISFEQAASVPVAAITALQGLRDKGRIQPGQKVLVDGASGGVGTFAIQIAKSFGAEVTAVCSPTNVETARSIGADQVIDYTRENFSHSGRLYNLIFAANAYRSIFDYRRALNQHGICVFAGGGGFQILQAMSLGPLLSPIGAKKMRFFVAKINKTDLLSLQGLLEAGKLVPVIDRRYPLSAVPEALRYLAAGHAQGKIVITAEPSSHA